MHPEFPTFDEIRKIALGRKSLGRLLSLLQIELGLEELESWYGGFVDVNIEYNITYPTMEEMIKDLEFEFFEHFKLLELTNLQDWEVARTREELRV